MPAPGGPEMVGTGVGAGLRVGAGVGVGVGEEIGVGIGGGVGEGAGRDEIPNKPRKNAKMTSKVCINYAGM